MAWMVNIFTYEFAEPIRPEDYRLLLIEVASLTEFFGLVVDGGLDRYHPRARELLGLLEADLVETQDDVSEWPGTRKIDGRGTTLYRYRVSAHSIQTLASAATNIYEWHHRQLPDDLHFLRADGSVLLGSVAHENDVWLELTVEEHAEWAGKSRLLLLPPEGSHESPALDEP